MFKILKMIRKLKNKKSLNAKRYTLNAINGQILVEAMVAITIAVVGLLGIFALLSQSLSLNKVVIGQSVGANLAVEGIELVKNLIDGNIIQKRPWNEGVGPGQYELDFTEQGLSANQNRFLNFDASTGEYNYRAGQPSRYQRVITVEEPAPDEIKVNSSVNWITRGGGEFSVDLEDHFFRWR